MKMKFQIDDKIKFYDALSKGYFDQDNDELLHLNI